MRWTCRTSNCRMSAVGLTAARPRTKTCFRSGYATMPHVARIIGVQTQPRTGPVRCTTTEDKASPAPPNEEATRLLRVHFLRMDGVAEVGHFAQHFSDAKGWGLHLWGDAALEATDWSAPLIPTGQISTGSYWDVALRSEGEVGFIVHAGDQKFAGGDLVTVPEDVTEVWFVEDCTSPLFSAAEAAEKAAGSLSGAAAHWVSADTFLWRVAPSESSRTFRLYASTDASLTFSSGVIDGATATHTLNEVADGSEEDDATVAALSKFPHLRGCTALKVQSGAISDKELASLVTSQLAVASADADGKVVQFTGVQIAGVLDNAFLYEGPLGDADDCVTVWAPTAQEVDLLVYNSATGGKPEEVAMTRNEKGAWCTPRNGKWKNRFYLFRSKVYHHTTQKMETLTFTDPYSRCTCANGERSMFVDLEKDSSLQPEGWADHKSPYVEMAVDISVYELHIRDFSASDGTVPESLRGKYLAFSESATGTQTDGQAHLRRLSDAGLSHLHLLPSYDFGSVPERASEQAVCPDLSEYAPDGEEQQAEVTKVAVQDAFNWGYDPVHYGVPEGSYATNPDTSSRVLEYRTMVQSIHAMGLCVVQDVVYNHTYASGLDRYSVLDKAVPGYYHRREEKGAICNSTCCNNVATEHAMAERLMIDDLVHWARHYKIDGFRFDIMGHIMLDSMVRVREALDALTPEADGVDGKKIYIYGEAWDFGEVAGNQRGTNASQLNIGGTGIGAFNDRLRDAAIGGSPFSPPTLQGFLTGLRTLPNETAKKANDDTNDIALLTYYTNLIALGLAGNLRDYELRCSDGVTRAGKDITFNDVPAGYCTEPSENVAYCGCHDNETLFDMVVLKLAHNGSGYDCACAAQLALGLIAVTQGVAFFHAGDDLLRSKSLDRDSYNSGDWFNRLLWDRSSNNFGVGLPPYNKNAATWPLKAKLLAQPSLVPHRHLLDETHDFMCAMLRVRASSTLFRLGSAEAICKQVSFGSHAQDTPGVLSMIISSSEDEDADPRWSDINYRTVCVYVNATHESVRLPYPQQVTPGSGSMSLHPDLEDVVAVDGCLCDDVERVVEIPRQTMCVMVERWPIVYIDPTEP